MTYVVPGQQEVTYVEEVNEPGRAARDNLSALTGQQYVTCVGSCTDLEEVNAPGRAAPARYVVYPEVHHFRGHDPGRSSD